MAAAGRFSAGWKASTVSFFYWHLRWSGIAIVLIALMVVRKKAGERNIFPSDLPFVLVCITAACDKVAL